MKTYKFDTTNRTQRINTLKKLAKKAGFTGYVNTQTEEFHTTEGWLFLDMHDVGTYSAKCQICWCDSGNPVLVVEQIS